METTRNKNRKDETLSTLGLKKVTKIGIWNVRTLYENGRIQQLGAEMSNYKLDIIGVGRTWRSLKSFVEALCSYTGEYRKL
jgi:hypothetical protein